MMKKASDVVAGDVIHTSPRGSKMEVVRIQATATGELTFHFQNNRVSAPHRPGRLVPVVDAES